MSHRQAPLMHHGKRGARFEPPLKRAASVVFCFEASLISTSFRSGGKKVTEEPSRIHTTTRTVGTCWIRAGAASGVADDGISAGGISPPSLSACSVQLFVAPVRMKRSKEKRQPRNKQVAVISACPSAPTHTIFPGVPSQAIFNATDEVPFGYSRMFTTRRTSPTEWREALLAWQMPCHETFYSTLGMVTISEAMQDAAPSEVCRSTPWLTGNLPLDAVMSNWLMRGAYQPGTRPIKIC